MFVYSIPYFVGKEITYKGFGGSNYGSREMTQAFQILEEVGLLNRIYSSRSIALPIVSNQRKRAKLIALDIGMTNFVIKQRKPFLGESIIENIYKGSIAEQFVGQTLIGQESKLVFKPNYWYRDKSGSTAEVDFLIELQGTLLPIEVKNSDEKQVRSIESFIDESRVNGINTEVCIRISANQLKINNQQTPKSNRFKLIDVPFYLAWKIRDGLIK